MQKEQQRRIARVAIWLSPILLASAISIAYTAPRALGKILHEGHETEKTLPPAPEPLILSTEEPDLPVDSECLQRLISLQTSITPDPAGLYADEMREAWKTVTTYYPRNTELQILEAVNTILACNQYGYTFTPRDAMGELIDSIPQDVLIALSASEAEMQVDAQDDNGRPISGSLSGKEATAAMVVQTLSVREVAQDIYSELVIEPYQEAVAAQQEAQALRQAQIQANLEAARQRAQGRQQARDARLREDNRRTFEAIEQYNRERGYGHR